MIPTSLYCKYFPYKLNERHNLHSQKLYGKQVDSNMLRDEIFSNDSIIEVTKLNLDQLTKENHADSELKIRKSAAAQTIKVCQ